MTKSELHHQPPSGCETKCCPQPCNCRYSSWPIWMLYVLMVMFVVASPIIIIIAINIWYIEEDEIPPALVNAIYTCAQEGSLHTDIRNSFRDPKLRDRNVGLQHPHRTHENGLCEDIKTIIHQSIRYCKECEEPEIKEELEIPLVFPETQISLTVRELLGDQGRTGNPDGTAINEYENCPGIEWIEIEDGEIKIYRPSDIDLPNFCTAGNPKENRNPEWELLEQPRIYHARTWMPGHDPKSELDPELTGGPYAVFIAKHLDGLCCEADKRGNLDSSAVRDKSRVTIFVVYVDYITMEPNIIEINIEVESGKPIVGVEDTIQLVSNVKLDSLKRQVTFQIGQGARRIVVAGYDFNAESTTSDRGPRRRSDEDTSGSYVVKLDDTGAVRDVCRVDLAGGC